MASVDYDENLTHRTSELSLGHSLCCDRLINKLSSAI